MYSNNYCYVYLFLDLTIRAILRIFANYKIIIGKYGKDFFESPGHAGLRHP